MKRILRCNITLASLLAILCVGTPVSAQFSPPPSAPAAGDGGQVATVITKLDSPDGKYSISMVNKPWLSDDHRDGFNNHYMLTLSQGDKEITEVYTWRELRDAYWSDDGKYLAVNNLRSDMGGDEVWVFALPSGKILKHPDDATSKTWMRTGEAAVEESFPVTAEPHGGGKTFLILKASGWQGDQLKFTVSTEEMYDDLEGNFDFNGMADPLQFPAISASSLALRGSGKLTADNYKDMTLQEQLLGWWASPKHAYVFKEDGMVYRQGAAAATTPPSHWKIQGGVYYEGSMGYDIVKMTGDEFVCRTRGPNSVTLTMKRISEADAEKY